jgi:predicted dehydrogenase
LGAGLPVICEKALATSSAEALAIHRQLAEHGGFLAVTYNYTGYPMLRELRQMVADGRFGKIEQIHVEMPQDGFARFGSDGSPLVPQAWRLRDGRVPTISLDLGVHLHMMVRFLTDETPVEVVATSNTYGNFGQVVDNVSCLARYTNNLNCNIWYSKTALGYRNGLKLRLFGEQGAAEWVQENPEYLTLTDHYGTKSVVDRASRDIKVANQGRYARFKVGHPAGFVEAFANYYCDTADALAAHLAGQSVAGEYVFGIEDALQGLRVLEAIADSSANRCWATVETGA